MPDLPVACTLGPDALAARREGLLARVVALAEGQDPIEDGWRLRFPASNEALTLIFQMVQAERKCCRFLRFAVAVEPAGGPVVVELTGPPGTRDFLSSLFA
jgi:hypothetical protein